MIETRNSNIGPATGCAIKPGLAPMNWSLKVALVVLFLTLFSRSSYGQSYLGTINGAVTDSTGAAIVGARVQAMETTTKFVSAATTNQQGLYSLQFLAPGTYDVTVKASGFSENVRTGVVLIPSDIKEVNFKVAPARTTQQVVVAADEVQLQTESANVGTDFTPNLLENTPTEDGNVYMMATRVAGVQATVNSEVTQWQAAGGGVSGTNLNGLNGGQLASMNGVNILPPEGGPGQYTGYIPPAFAVQHLDVQITPYDAAFGHTLGGVENTTLKTGTQRPHVELSFLYGDKIFNSNTEERTAQNIPRNDITWSQPSVIVTGPVIIPGIYHHASQKTFFMAAWEHQQFTTVSSSAFTGNVPTVKEQAGDFSELSNAANPSNNPAILTGLIFDPTTTVPSGASGAYAPWCSPKCAPGMRESFRQEYNEVANPLNGSTNYIPSSRFNPVGANLLKYWPQPMAGISSATQPYIGNYSPSTGLSMPTWIWMGVVSIDHEFNENNKLTVSYLPYSWNQILPNENFPYVGKYTAGPGVQKSWRNEQGGLIDYVRTLSPTMVLDARTGGFYHSGLVQERVSDNMPLSVLGMTGDSASFPRGNFPAVAASGPFGSYTSLSSGAGVYEYSAIWDNYVTLSKALQRHMIKTGFEFLYTRTDPTNPVSAIANNSNPFKFDSTFTNYNPNSGTVATNGGDGIASLLLGYPTSGAANIAVSPAYAYNYWAAFVQDDWRITSKLTLNLGVRYDYAGPPTERHNQMVAGFDFSSKNPFNLPNAEGTGIASSIPPPANPAVPQGYTGGLYFVNTPQYPSRLAYNREYGDRWQPRIGASYHVFRNTVLRGGYAVFFEPNYGGTQNTGFSSTTSLVASTNGNFTPPTCSSAQGADAYGFCNIANPYPNGFVSPTRTLLGLSTGLGQSVGFAGPSWLPGKDMIWSAGLQQELPFNMLLDIEYHGNEIVGGSPISKNWNALPNCYYYGGGCPNAGNATALNATVANPMAGYMPTTSSLNAAKLPQEDLYLPYPEFGSVTQTVTVIDGTSQRVGNYWDNGLYITLNKRLSHGLEASIAGTYMHEEQANILLNAADPVTAAPKFDTPNPNKYFVASIVYDTPTLNVSHGLGYLVNDWKWSHSLNWYAGNEVYVPGSSFRTGGAETTNHQSLAHWFNTCYIPVVANGNVGQTLNGAVNASPVFGTPTNCQNGEQPAWTQQPTMTLNQVQGYTPMRNVRSQEEPIYDMALLKNIPIREGVAFSVRVEAHNVFNIPLLGGGANTSLTSATFGANSPAATIDGNPVYPQENDPRIVRFETRLNF